MSIELWSVFVTGIMMWVSIAVQQFQLDIKAGIGYALSNRDTAAPDSAVQDRMMRAVRNQADVAAVWIPLVVVQQFLDVSSALTYWPAVAVIVSRLLYFPLYAIGAVPFRSLSWGLFFAAAPVFAYGVYSGLGAAP
ncbi:MAG: MAPEG family protein [Pseudomonadota bacterium]